MSARTAVGTSASILGSVAPRALLGLLHLVGLLALTIVPAGAQIDGGPTAPTPAPILTVADATIERCGPVAVTGAGFAPDAEIDVAVNGTREQERPATDASGGFSFTTAVECKQESGFLTIQASDGRSIVAIDIAVATPPEPIATGRGAAATDEARIPGDLVVWLVRIALVAVVVAELLLLAKRQHRRRARRDRTVEPVSS